MAYGHMGTPRILNFGARHMLYLTSGIPAAGMSLNVCPPKGVNGESLAVTAPGSLGLRVGIRPLTALYLELRKNRVKAEVDPSSEYRLYSLEFARSLKGLVDKAKFCKECVEFDHLCQSINDLVAVYVARLVSDRDNHFSAPSGGLTGLFECLDDFRVFSVRYASLYQSGLHAAALAGYVRLFRYFPKYLRRELGAL